MTDPKEDFPETSGLNEPHTLGQETLLHLLTSSGIAELAIRGGLTTIHVDKTPKDTGELYMNPDGEPVYGFMTKFSEGFTGWENGDLVRARFVIKPNDEGVSLIVADSYVGDIRLADEFVLEGDSQELRKLLKLGITELDLDVKVTSEKGKYKGTGKMFEYSASIDRVNSILAPWDGESELEPGQVLVQGRVTEYVAADKGDQTNKKATYMTLDINGKSVVVNMNAGYVAYEDSPYENLLNDMPEIGDIVQVLTSYDPNFGQTPYHRPRVSAFDTSWCRSTHCLVANPDRVSRQEAFNAAAESIINELAGISDQATFRKKYGELIDLTVVDTFRGYFKNCLTAEQKKRVNDMVSQVFSEKELLQESHLLIE